MTPDIIIPGIIAVAVAIVTGIASFTLASIRETQRHAQMENKKLADAVLVQNEKHKALETDEAVTRATTPLLIRIASLELELDLEKQKTK